MEPSTGVFVGCLIFLAVYVAIDRVASVLRDQSRDKADVEKKKADATMLEDLSKKLVETMQWMHGGVTGDAVRRFGGKTVDSEGRETNGPAQPVQYRDNGQHTRVPEGFPQPRSADTASR